MTSVVSYHGSVGNCACFVDALEALSQGRKKVCSRLTGKEKLCEESAPCFNVLRNSQMTSNSGIVAASYFSHGLCAHNKITSVILKFL